MVHNVCHLSYQCGDESIASSAGCHAWLARESLGMRLMRLKSSHWGTIMPRACVLESILRMARPDPRTPHPDPRMAQLDTPDPRMACADPRMACADPRMARPDPRTAHLGGREGTDATRDLHGHRSIGTDEYVGTKEFVPSKAIPEMLSLQHQYYKQDPVCLSVSRT